MPLYANAERVIRENLDQASNGLKPKPVTIGRLSDAQLTCLNDARNKVGLPSVDGSVFFRGSHIYDSRVLRDNYSVEDVILQIQNAFAVDSVVRFNPKMSTLQNRTPRNDGYGNSVKDEIALECTGRHPKAEIFSVIPKGDKIKPPLPVKDESHPEVALEKS